MAEPIRYAKVVARNSNLIEVLRYAVWFLEEVLEQPPPKCTRFFRVHMSVRIEEYDHEGGELLGTFTSERRSTKTVTE